MSVTESNMVYCHECNRGGNGNDNDKCSCGWRQINPSYKGCFLGTPIVGAIKKHPKISKSKMRYQKYLNMSECFDSFRDFLRSDYSKLIN